LLGIGANRSTITFLGGGGSRLPNIRKLLVKIFSTLN